MTQQRTDYVVTYLGKTTKGTHKRSFPYERDARTYADRVDALRIERITIETLWECDEGEPDSDRPQPKFDSSRPVPYLS